MIYKRQFKKYNETTILCGGGSMGYTKYKAITKKFNFSNVLDKKRLPAYIKQYVHQDECILTAYKTSRDHGIFTDRKIILFDNYNKRKQIYTIFYESISTLSIIFEETSAKLCLFLDSGYPVNLKFINMNGEDKLRLRLLYTCMSRLINNQELFEMDKKRLIDDNISFSN